MNPLRILLLGFAAALAASPRAFGDYTLEGGRLAFGLNGTLDVDAGISGPAADHEAVLGSVLGHAVWTQTPADPRPVTWSAYASFLWIQGRGPTGRFLGDVLGADNIEGFQSLRLYSWWAQADHNDWSLRAGVLLADEEFACVSSGATLINSSFGWPDFISANTLNTGPAYFVAAPGVRLAFADDSGWSAKAGFYDGDSFDSASGDPGPSRHGTHYGLGGGQGVFMIWEIGCAPKDSPNRYHLGAWHHTADFADLGTGALHSGNQGAYAIYERTLAGKTGERGNIEAHVRYGLAPDDRNEIAYGFDASVAATGLFPGRPADVAALGFSHAGLSRDLPGRDYEQVVELNYSAPLNDHITLEPDVQCIRHPGGTSANADAWLFIFRVAASY